jgi:aminoglycoside phosphotransferase (APT) family kinase protein
MLVGLTTAPTVGDNLLGYMSERLGVAGLRYRQAPQAITDGWETYIYRFQLAGASALPVNYATPLVLRIYASNCATDRLRHEFAVQSYMCQLGYPVAEPLLCEPHGDPFGGPFMIMKQLPGQTLLDAMLRRPWRIVNGPTRMADLHAHLHVLPGGDFPADRGPFLERHLEELERGIDEYELNGLRPGLGWLIKHRPPRARTASILHLDFHPVNIIFDQSACQGVLDWGESDVGDRHADVAATLVLIRSAPVEVGSRWQHSLVVPGRWLLRRRYLKAYHRRLPLENDRLAYYVAWASLRRLCRYGMWLHAGPWVTGGKPSSVRYLSASRVDILRRCFYEQTGINLTGIRNREPGIRGRGIGGRARTCRGMASGEEP